MQTHWLCVYREISSEISSLHGNPPLILSEVLLQHSPGVCIHLKSRSPAFCLLTKPWRSFSGPFPPAVSGCDNQQPPAAPWDGPKFLLLLQRMSFSDRRICLKLSTLVFLSDVAQPLSPKSSVWWWMCWHFGRHRRSLDRASLPHFCVTGIVEAHKYLPVWTEI